MTVLNVLWDVISDIIVTLIGVLYFGESLNTMQCICLALSLTGITLMGAHSEVPTETKKEDKS